jgi:hypothetical protein
MGTLRGGILCDRRSFMGAYIGADERFGSGDEDPNQRRFEHVISCSPARESAYREIAELKDKLAQEKLYLEDEICGKMDFEGIVGQSSGLRHVLDLVETVAPSDWTVLLPGETGTGKELIARTIHGGRRDLLRHQLRYISQSSSWRTQPLHVLSPRPGRGEGIGGEGR